MASAINGKRELKDDDERERILDDYDGTEPMTTTHDARRPQRTNTQRTRDTTNELLTTTKATCDHD